MRAMRLLFVAAAAIALWAGPGAEAGRADGCSSLRGRRCSTPPGRPGTAALSARALAAARLTPGESIVVPVVYHVVYGFYVAPAGEKPDELKHAPPLALVHRQTQALNRAFRGTGISFQTEEATRRDFAPWRDEHEPPGARIGSLTAMVRDLTANREESLHVFLMREAQNRAAPPDVKSMFENVAAADGILMNWDYLPYVPTLRQIDNPVFRRYFFEGEMLVHLVGHYLGLLHTFEPWPGQEVDERGCAAECNQTSDLVRDTPAHRWIWGNLGRCIPLDTCSNAPGMDPITNYMNLEPDLCASEFTPGQVARMESMVRSFRPYLIVSAAGNDP